MSQATKCRKKAIWTFHLILNNNNNKIEWKITGKKWKKRKSMTKRMKSLESKTTEWLENEEQKRNAEKSESQTNAVWMRKHKKWIEEKGKKENERKVLINADGPLIRIKWSMKKNRGIAICFEKSPFSSAVRLPLALSRHSDSFIVELKMQAKRYEHKEKEWKRFFFLSFLFFFRNKESSTKQNEFLVHFFASSSTSASTLSSHVGNNKWNDIFIAKNTHTHTQAHASKHCSLSVEWWMPLCAPKLPSWIHKHVNNVTTFFLAPIFFFCCVVMRASAISKQCYFSFWFLSHRCFLAFSNIFMVL